MFSYLSVCIFNVFGSIVGIVSSLLLIFCYSNFKVKVIVFEFDLFLDMIYELI